MGLRLGSGRAQWKFELTAGNLPFVGRRSKISERAGKAGLWPSAALAMGRKDVDFAEDRTLGTLTPPPTSPA